LRQALAERFGRRLVRAELALRPVHGRARAELYRRGAVIAEMPDNEGGWRIEVELSTEDLEALCRREQMVWSPSPVATA